MQSNPQPTANQPNPQMQQFNTMQMGQMNQMGGGMGMNPFGNSGISYQNPNHNRANYQTSVQDNPFGGQGPSAESWQRDVNHLGFNVDMGAQQPKKNNDNVKEFQDLFAFGTNNIKASSAPKTGIDLTYNPGVQPAPAQAKPAMMMAQPAAPAQHKPPAKQLSLFDDNSAPIMMAPPKAEPVLENDPFANPPAMGDIAESFG